MIQRISCDNFELAVQERMDQRLPISGDVALCDHAEICPTCAEVLWDFLALEDGLFALADSSSRAAVGLNTVASREIASVEKRLEHGRFGLIGIVASIAAVLIISLSLSNLTSSTSNTETAKLDGNQAKAIAKADDQKRDIQPETIKQPAPAMNQATAPMKLASYNLLPRQLQSTPLYRLSFELPGVRPVYSSINVTVDLLQQTFQPQDEKSSEGNPDLGFKDVVVNQRV